MVSLINLFMSPKLLRIANQLNENQTKQKKTEKNRKKQKKHRGKIDSRINDFKKESKRYHRYRSQVWEQECAFAILRHFLGLHLRARTESSKGLVVDIFEVNGVFDDAGLGCRFGRTWLRYLW